MTVRAELSSEVSSTAPTYIRILRRRLVTANRSIDRFPGQKQRVTQLAVDGFTALAAVFLAWQMHSDFAAPMNNVRAIWILALLMFIGRPLALMLVTRYRVPWHEVRIPDIAELSVASIPPSLLALAFCVFGRQSWAVVPSGVIATELPLFVGMAGAMRCLRRAAYEQDRRSTMGSQTLTASNHRASISNLLSQLLPVGAADLPRPAAWDRESLDTYRDRVVLVTGAGGSIGSELCRKLARLPISRLLLLDIDETAIFEIDHELEDCSPERVPIIGDIRKLEFLRHVFEQHRPHMVLHAAAYKHVRLMEANPSAAILNNVIGTRNLLDVAVEACEHFLLISTDKAVEPASIMGATKRLAELLVQSRAAQSSMTRFACVRFGNVFGSRGSVVPIFLKQIQQDKPITLTDSRMTRYFMTAEQAADLALLACTLAERGEIYVLKTGEPINIRDLACRLAETWGGDRSADLSFKITGVRRGEKLHESLWEREATLIPTPFPGMFAISPFDVPNELEQNIAELERLATVRRDAGIIEKLETIGIGYEASRPGDS